MDERLPRVDVMPCVTTHATTSRERGMPASDKYRGIKSDGIMHRSFVALLNTAVYRLAVLTVTYNFLQGTISLASCILLCN